MQQINVIKKRCCLFHPHKSFDSNQTGTFTVTVAAKTVREILTESRDIHASFCLILARS